jgi:hypothetical protein
MTTTREAIVQDIDRITKMVQQAIIQEVERSDEEIGVLVTDALHSATMHIDPESVITKEVFHKIANDAFYQAIFDTLDYLKASSF